MTYHISMWAKMKESGDTRCWQKDADHEEFQHTAGGKGCTLGKPIWKTVYHLGVLKSHSNPKVEPFHSTKYSYRWLSMASTALLMKVKGWKEPHIWLGLDTHQQEKGPIVGCSYDETFYGSESM